ncbi:MAG: succinate dehydrogenase/fumarate reductase transmembrane subunit [Planctomycetota bacterium]|jgi:succinate dehydrogenase / fumarate reductase cytochrome b subunit
MSEHASQPGFLDRHYFLLRRLHSLAGVVPIGVFLFPHLTTNSSIVWGRYLRAPAITGEALAGSGAAPHGGVEMFQHEVDFIHALPALVLIEIFVLFLPIAFHAGLGVWFAQSGRPNVRRYAYQDNWRYTLQRWTGYLGVLYIFLHISSLRWGWSFGGLLPVFEGHAASSTTAAHFQGGAGLLVTVFYLVSVLALVFHFANGLWTAAITWGLTVSETAQNRWGWICTVIGVGLGAAGIASVLGFATLDIEQARAIEAVMATGH